MKRVRLNDILSELKYICENKKQSSCETAAARDESPVGPFEVRFVSAIDRRCWWRNCR